jgi:hypothetical protein
MMLEGTAVGWEADAVKRIRGLIDAATLFRYDGTGESFAVFAGWSARAKVALESILGPGHTYIREFIENCDFNAGPRPAIEILSAVLADLEEGYLRKTANIISAEVFADFLEMTQHLLEQGYKDPAASLCGAVLEDGLRRIARNRDLKVNDKDDLNSLRDKCAQSGVINSITRQQITAWTTLRNAADHGKFQDYAAEEVRLMIAGVRSFLASHLG